MKESYRKKRTLWVWLGLGALLLEYLTADASWWVESWDLVVFLSYLAYGLWFLAVGALIYGSYCWAKYKGRNGWFALLGLIAPIGFIFLAGLKDKFSEVVEE